MTWWRRLLRRNQAEEQLEKELRFHLEQHTADLIARGQHPEEARRQARLALGGEEHVKEECRDARGTRWLEDLWQDLRYALRTLHQKPGFAVVTLATLGLGIGATTVMFTVINGVVLKPLSYPEPDRLVTVHGRTEKYGEQWGFSYPEFLDCQRQSRSLGPIAAWTYGGGTLSEPGEAEYVNSRQISSELFSVLGISLPNGRAFLPEEDRPGAAPVIIISYGLWQRRYAGSPATIGKPIVFDGKPYTVIGITPAGLRLDGEADLFTPLAQSTDPRMHNRGARFIHLVARVRPGVGLAEAQAELSLIARGHAEQYPETDAGRGLVAHPLRQELVGNVQSTLWLLLGAVSLVLLIACVNVASLMLARAVSRERELAMRVALGAGRGRLVRQCLTESAVLGIYGGVLGVVLAACGIRPFVVFWPGSLPRAEEIQVDWHVLLFAFAASLASGLLFGLAPALRAPARELEQTLRAGARTLAGGTRRMHSGFVISEIALAVVLLVSAGMLGRTIVRLASLDPGVNIRNVLATRIALSPNALTNPAQIRAVWQDVLDRGGRVPGVQSIALADIVPMREGENSVGYWATPFPPPPNQEPLALASCVSPDYLKVMGIPLRQGRFFNEEDRVGHDLVVVIDDVLAQHAFGGSNPVGKRLWIPAMGRGPIQVVGVVGHVRHWGLAGDDHSRVRDQIYYPFAQVPDSLLRIFSSFMSMVVRTSVAPLSVVEPLRREVRGAGGDQALYDVHTMEQLVSDSLSRQRFLLVLFGVFAGLALVLACIGIYGVLAYLTSQRVPEFGVRMALGANARDVMQLVMRESVGMIFLGVGAGIAGAWAAGRVLVRLVEGVQSSEPVTFAVMIPILVVAALYASFVPARRASRVDPVKALRQE
ncbi:MAG TPA: ABC transporter permease [Bryobacteraceae bacterium]|nr:ABC transporter permease [Bryobacteraceae bacterium]